MEQQLQQERIVIENDDEIEIDLKDLVLEILSFWKWVLFALIIGAVTAYCISRFVMVPQYESTSQFYVLSKSMSITSLADIQTGTSLTNDYMKRSLYSRYHPNVYLLPTKENNLPQSPLILYTLRVTE